MSRDLKALCGILDTERDCLLRGDLKGALAMTQRKAELADRIENTSDVLRSEVERMRTKAERNVALLQAANEGLTTARERIRAILLGVSTQTYSADGTRIEIPVPHRGVERRA